MFGRGKQYDEPFEMSIELDKTYTATLDTNHGRITIEFDATRSPLTVNNFVSLARDGFYDGVVFHRVIEGFMIQGGDPTGTGTGGPGYRFRDELEGEGRYTRGTVAMANAGPNTAGSQFFLVLADIQLDPAFSVFGEVTDGFETMTRIASLPMGSNPGDFQPSRPLETVYLESVEILR